MSSNKTRINRYALFLGIIALAIFTIGCDAGGFPTPPSIPASQLSSSVHPRNLIGDWQGCIQGVVGAPNETLSLNVFEEKPDGTFLGKYNENYSIGVPFLGSDDRIARDVLASNTRIDQNNNVQFSVAVQRNTSGSSDDPNLEENWTYIFKGVLVKAGVMEGQVSEGEPGNSNIATHTFGWELSDNGGQCPSWPS